MMLALLAIFSTAMAQQRERRVEPAGVLVRYPEGTAHGFLELRTAAGALLAHGDVLQAGRGQEIESRMVFHFADASVFEETVTFTQHGVFTMQTYHLVQSGPAFADDLAKGALDGTLPERAERAARAGRPAWASGAAQAAREAG